MSAGVSELFQRERGFIAFVLFAFVVAYFVAPYPSIAMWVGFALAGYSAVSNDSIQTLGTFIASNSEQKWYLLWLYIGLIFLATVTYSFVAYNGDVSYERLSTKGFSEAPTSFHFLQVAAPVFLLIITRMRMPISTTFLLLTSFAVEPSGVEKVLVKSLSGYVLAFVLAIVIWFLFARLMRDRFQGPVSLGWKVALWVTSGALWSFWIMQDAANIAVYLPRQLSLTQFIFFAGTIFFGLGLIFYRRGDRIQAIVDEKSGVSDVRMSAVVNFVYALIIYFFKVQSKVPMSTTWVFLGLLGGRELAMNLVKVSEHGLSTTMKMIGRDLLYASIGLIVSIILALGVNETFREQLFASF